MALGNPQFMCRLRRADYYLRDPWCLLLQNVGSKRAQVSPIPSLTHPFRNKLERSLALAFAFLGVLITCLYTTISIFRMSNMDTWVFLD